MFEILKLAVVIHTKNSAILQKSQISNKIFSFINVNYSIHNDFVRFSPISSVVGGAKKLEHVSSLEIITDSMLSTK